MSQSNPNPEKNVADFEMFIREQLLALDLKKEEVSKLKFEVDSLSSENYELKRSLESSQKSLEENQITTNIFVQKAQQLEQKYQEKRDALIKTELQYKMVTAKLESLQEELQKVSKEKAELLKKVIPLEKQTKVDSQYQTELKTKVSDLKVLINNVNTDLNILKHSQQEAFEKFDENNMSEELLEKCTQLAADKKALVAEKLAIEEAYVKAKAKLEKLEELISPDRLKQDCGLQIKAVLTKFRKSNEQYKELIEEKNQLIKTLTEKTAQEKKNNYKLIQTNIKLTEENKTLKASLDFDAEKQAEETSNVKQNNDENKPTVHSVKNEPIEISDSE